MVGLTTRARLRPARVRLLASLLAVVAVLSAVTAVPVAAAGGWVEFGDPTASSAFGTGVTFNQPVTVTRVAARAELLITQTDAVVATLIDVAGPIDPGSTNLTYLLDPSVDGHMLPNTPLTARWRLVSADDPTDVEVGPPVQITYEDDRFDWQTAGGDLVKVHWYEGSDAFGARALAIGEEAVEQAAALLKVTETEPIDFFVYADQTAFYDALGPGTRENVGGQANSEIRTMFALIPTSEIDQSWVGVVIPHELTHLVFDTAASNPYHFPPRWLNEGLAVYLSQGYDASDRGAVERAAGSGSLIPLDGLIGQFPTSGDRFSLAYSESVSAVDYLIRAHGRDALVDLIRSYADGHTDDEAFGAAIGIDMTALGAAWLEDLGAAAPVRYGPQPAPPGPTPAAWNVAPGASQGNAGATSAPNSPAQPGDSPPAGSSAALPIGMVVLIAGAIVVLLWFRRRGHGRIETGPP